MVVVKINGEGSVDYWTAGKLSVCVMYWRDTGVEDGQRFYEILLSNVPFGTEMLGRKLSGCQEGSDYCVLFGFPYRVGSWAGLKPELVKGCREKGVSICCRVGVLFPVAYGDIWQSDVEAFVKHVQSELLEEGGEDAFGYPLTVKVEDGVSPSLKVAGDMWHSL